MLCKFVVAWGLAVAVCGGLLGPALAEDPKPLVPTAIGTEWDGLIRLNAHARKYHNREAENNKKDGTEFSFLGPEKDRAAGRTRWCDSRNRSAHEWPSLCGFMVEPV